MADYLIKATAAQGRVRAFACDTKNTCEFARQAHQTSPVVTAALGRMLSAGLMMGSMMKGEEDLLTLKIEGSGPMKGVLVSADSRGNVKGYPFCSIVDLPPNAQNKLDVAEAIGVGVLSVIADVGMKEPYIGQVELISGEIAEDLTYYYALSEQTPSSVVLGVLMNKNNTVSAAGGFILQLMPDCGEEIISELEKRIAQTEAVSTLLAEGKTPEEILCALLEGMEPEIHEKMEIGFHCSCSEDKIKKALVSVGEKELREMIDEGKDIEVCCHFCKKAYRLGKEDLEELYQRAK
ncbi:MAG: Hsp33 family molecular chaperone HslO [Johnsonella sp.]|nr:Hsp33 family molecular chaperone HslO [Johnsonella sp.]